MELQAIFFLRRTDWEKPLYYAREPVQSYATAERMAKELARRERAYVSVTVENWALAGQDVTFEVTDYAPRMLG